MHRIHLEDGTKPKRDAQRKLNPNLSDVVKKKILKLLDEGIIYPISDSEWVSPIHVVPKKMGMTVVKINLVNWYLQECKVGGGW